MKRLKNSVFIVNQTYQNRKGQTIFSHRFHNFIQKVKLFYQSGDTICSTNPNDQLGSLLTKVSTIATNNQSTAADRTQIRVQNALNEILGVVRFEEYFDLERRQTF